MISILLREAIDEAEESEGRPRMAECMQKRDPGVNPEAGDRLAKGDRTRFVFQGCVFGAEGECVGYRDRNGRRHWTYLWQWREWARSKNVEVIHAAE